MLEIAIAQRKPFISALYVFITIFYNMLISDLKIDEYALFSKGYYLLLTLLCVCNCEQLFLSQNIVLTYFQF